MLVIPKENGFCGGVSFVKGVEIDISKDILKALGKDAYEVVPQEIKEEKKQEEKKLDAAPEDKQITTAKNK